jgi:NADP-dependent 3-hydroxy acid dehydrogenase YdfG
LASTPAACLNIAAAVVPHLIEQGGGRIVTVGAAGA